MGPGNGWDASTLQTWLGTRLCGTPITAGLMGRSQGGNAAKEVKPRARWALVRRYRSVLRGWSELARPSEILRPPQFALLIFLDSHLQFSPSLFSIISSIIHHLATSFASCIYLDRTHYFIALLTVARSVTRSIASSSVNKSSIPAHNT